MTRALIKLGGTLLEAPESRARLASEISQAAEGHAVTVVHGGGKQMTEFLKERGVESRFVNGLRVTGASEIDAVIKVFAGSVNTNLVASFRAAGARAVGLTGIDAGLVDAEILDPELGQVGRPRASDARLLEVLTREGYLPVVACVAGDPSGHIYNVNADQMAVACAISFKTATLLFLTDVDGVRQDGKVLGTVTVAQARELIRNGIATGGMQAKLEAAIHALEQGVGEVWIAPGAALGAVRTLLNGGHLGTRLIA